MYSTSSGVSIRASTLELLHFPVLLGAHLQTLARLESGFETENRIALATSQAQALAVLSVDEFEREHAHPDQVTAMYPLEALRDHGANAEQ